ncbi:MAG: aminotransferase class I/II-fold pyridoxal phosphate-dependent enzyme, partial [Desulfomonilaceae bacterium]
MLKDYSRNWDIISEIEALRGKALYRKMPVIMGIPGRTISVDGVNALNFSSNNYLGLASHPRVLATFAYAVKTHGAGSTASRLITGNCASHRELEEFIANWKKTEASLVFGSGYQANLAILTTLTGRGDLVISDELNHASIIDGCRLSRAETSIYKHLDLNSALDALKRTGFRRKLLVTESIFSMDGDQAPLKELSNLCQENDAFMVVDEAHSTGIYGPSGEGLCSELGVVPDVQMGTLGKAVGVSGAYVAGSRSLIDLLINRARSFIYTTAHSPAVSSAALEALKIIVSSEGNVRRSLLKNNIKTMSKNLQKIFPHNELNCHILPIHIGPSDRTMEMSQACLKEGLFVQGIRFPTVREGSARLRLTLISDHTTEDLGKA